MRKSTPVIVRKLPARAAPDEGRYYALVYGKRATLRGRSCWPTKMDALRCGVLYHAALVAAARAEG